MYFVANKLTLPQGPVSHLFTRITLSLGCTILVLKQILEIIQKTKFFI